MALMGYNPKRKDTPPPVDSVEIYYMKTLDIPISEGRLTIKSQQLTEISFKADSEGEQKRFDTPQRCTQTEAPLTSHSHKDQFRTWRSSDTKPSKKERECEIKETPDMKKPKDMSRSRSLTPNHYSSGKPKIPSMKRSATFSGKIKIKKSTKNVKTLDDYRNGKMLKETGKNGIKCCQAMVTILVVVVAIFLCMCLIKHNPSTPPYDHNEVLINITGFNKYLENNFFHQMYTVKLVQETLKDELNGEKHEKPLVLSFHGGAGVGKTFLAEAIAKYLFTKGLDSQCVHNFICSLHITDGGNNINRDIMDWFLEQTSVRCPLELFIVDNMEMLNPHLINYLLQKIQKLLSDSSLKSAILILTSTIGKEQLMYTRECIDENCFLERTDTIKKELQSWKRDNTISMHVESSEEGISFPESSQILIFLPLKREHVKLCARRVLQQQLSTDEINEELLEKVASEISFIDVGNGEAYSLSGCKQVAEKVILHI